MTLYAGLNAFRVRREILYIVFFTANDGFNAKTLPIASLGFDSLVGLFFPCYGSFLVSGCHVFAWYNFVLCGHIAASHKELSITCNAQIVILAFCVLFLYVFVVFDVVVVSL